MADRLVIGSEEVSGSFRLGDVVERDLDGLKFTCQVLTVNLNRNVCDVVYLDDKNVEQNVEFMDISKCDLPIGLVKLSNDEIFEFISNHNLGVNDQYAEDGLNGVNPDFFLEVRQLEKGTFIAADGTRIIAHQDGDDELKTINTRAYAAGSPLRLIKWLKETGGSSDRFEQSSELPIQTRPMTAAQQQRLRTAQGSNTTFNP